MHDEGGGIDVAVVLDDGPGGRLAGGLHGRRESGGTRGSTDGVLSLRRVEREPELHLRDHQRLVAHAVAAHGEGSFGTVGPKRVSACVVGVQATA